MNVQSGHAKNDEIRMTKDEGNPSDEARLGSARALACCDWRPRQALGWIHTPGSRFEMGRFATRASRTAREARALPRPVPSLCN
jgi:hypothetical protein